MIRVKLNRVSFPKYSEVPTRLTIFCFYGHEADLFSVVGVETLIKEGLHRLVEMGPHAGKLMLLIGISLKIIVSI